MIRHLVFLQFADGATEQKKQNLYDQLASLSDCINGILDFQNRKNVSGENPLVRDFRDMFWFDFRDQTVRNVYLENDVHQAIGGRIVESLANGANSVFVCDIEV